MTDLLIVRGAPGVGKSSVGKLLTIHYRNGLTIEIDEIRRMKNRIDWTSVEEHLNAIEATGSLINSYLGFNYKPIMVFDTLSMGTIQMITGKIPSGRSYKIISLVATDEIISERIAKRNEGFMDCDTSFKVNSAIANEVLENNLLIDTSALSVDEVFRKIIEAI